MVPISDKTHLADLKKFHRRQRRLFIVGFINADSAVSRVDLAGEERPVEVEVTPFTAHNSIRGAGRPTGPDNAAL